MGSYDAALGFPGHALGFQRLSWPFLGLRCKVGLFLRNLQLFPLPKPSHWGNSGMPTRISEWTHEQSILVLKGIYVTPGTQLCIGKVREAPPRAVWAPERHFDTPKKPTLANFGRFWAAFSPLTKQIGRVGAQYCTQVHSIGRARTVCKRYMDKLILNCFSAPFRPKLAKIDTIQPKKGLQS